MVASSPSLQVYKASAGSGKTFTLSAEYIYQLLTDTHRGIEKAHSHILAITFTNKATAEMKNRILSYLYHLQTGTIDEGFLSALRQREPLRSLSRSRLRELSQQALHDILHDYDHFNVRTIDSFLQGLLSHLAKELGIPANSAVSLNDNQVIQTAISRFLLEKPQTNEQLQKWLQRFIAQRMENQKSWNLERDLFNFAKSNVLSDDFQLMEDSLKKKIQQGDVLENYRKTLQAALKEQDTSEIDNLVTAIKDLLDDLGSDVDKRKCNWLNSFLDNVYDGNKSPSNSVLKIAAGEDTITKKSAKNSYMEEHYELCKNLQLVIAKREALLYFSNSVELSLKQLFPLQILNELDAIINAVNLEMNHVLLSRTKQIFSKMVEKEDAPFLFERAGITYHHIMIDEFQDTARTQWDNLKKLLIDFLSQGKTALIVGDIKQSIYRWNGGDWNILQYIDEEVAPQEVKTKTLATNYRSTEEIICFNNAFFESAARVIDKGGRIVQLYSDVKQNCTNKRGGYVKAILGQLPTSGQKHAKSGEEKIPTWTALDDESEDGQYRNAHSLYEEIHALQEKGCPLNSMAILVRGYADMQQVLDYFTTLHPEISVISQEAFLLSSSPFVSFIIHLLRWMQSEQSEHPEEENRTALLTALRLYEEIIAQRDYDREQLVQQPETFLPKALDSRMKRTLLLQLPLYDLMMQIVHIFQLNYPASSSIGGLFSEADCQVQGQQSFLFFFLDSVQHFVESNTSSLPDFLTYWDETLATTAIPSTESEGISIYTIHKSKGLAFDHVLIPFCNWALEKEKAPVENYFWWDTRADENYKNLFGSIEKLPISYASACENSIYKTQYLDEQFKKRIDNLNLLYVAFTRPKKTLTFWSESKDDTNEVSKWNINDLTYYNLLHTSSDMDETASELPIPTFQESMRKLKFPNCSIVNATPQQTVVTICGDEVRVGPEEKSDNTVETTLPFPVAHTQVETMRFTNYASHECFRQSSLCGEFWNLDENQSGELTPIERGNLYHKALSLIEFRTDLDKVVRRMEAEGWIPLATSAAEMQAYLAEKLDQPQIQPWFEKGKWKVYNENSILFTGAYSKEFAERRPDRVMVGKDEVVVIDFKFGQPEEKHKKQVQNYMRLLSKMGYQQPKGVLWYVELDQVVTC